MTPTSLRRALLAAVVDAGRHGVCETVLYADFARDYPLLIPDVLRKHLAQLRSGGHVRIALRAGYPWRARPTAQGRALMEETS